jgi:hypothetical protein
MIENLDTTTLLRLLQTVFGLAPRETGLAIFVDLPNDAVPDNEAWKDRRTIAGEWFTGLYRNRERSPFQSLSFCRYENVGSNNNDLRDMVFLTNEPPGEELTAHDTQVPLRQVLEASSVVLALTELSATAPLKVLAKQFGFRGATLPGFTRSMIPTLSLDFEKVNSRVLEFKKRLDDAQGMALTLATREQDYQCYFDLRFRSAHASSGLMRERGVVGNLPSGEAYSVPYEGEKAGEPSKTSGLLPVQFGQEIVVYSIQENKATRVAPGGPMAEAERLKLVAEPAYGNIAELGIGVLGEWGVQAIGSTLLDEKLGLHIAFGRSEHFGGIIGPSAFRDPRNVIHIDRVYVPSCQPLIGVKEATFIYADGRKETIIRSGKYLV